MKISELAGHSGVPASTLSFYEAEGLLPADREANGYRTYGQAAVDRLAFITQAKTLDLPLGDIRELVTAWESEPCSAVRGRYRPILAGRAAEVGHRIASLDARRDTLTRAVARLDALPDRDQPCDAGCAFLGAKTTAPSLVVCTLEAGSDYADRIGAWHQLLAGTGLFLVGSSVRATLAIDKLEATVALAAAEHCCAFFDFRLDLHGSTFDVTTTAPPEGPDMLAELLPDTTKER